MIPRRMHGLTRLLFVPSLPTTLTAPNTGIHGLPGIHDVPVRTCPQGQETMPAVPRQFVRDQM
jgi:hypothetical protein